MEEGLIRVTPDKSKAGSILKMAETTAEMIKTIDENIYPSNVVKEYYEVIRELISAVLLLDGFKAYGEGAHKKVIEYLEKNYKDFSNHEISAIDELRIIRNKISYDGFFVNADYIKRKRELVRTIIKKLQALLKGKLNR